MKIVEGYAASLCFKKINWSLIGIPCLINFSEVNMTYSDFECCDEDIVSEKITIDQLHDMVVLKRNDVGDATHENLMYPYVKLTDGWYYFDKGETNKWLKSTGGKQEYFDKLKLIKEKHCPETEYLLQGKNGEKLLESIEQLKANNVDSTLAERESQYGSFSDVAELTCDLMGDLLRHDMSFVQREALHMICSKLARIRCGDINYKDNWHDIAGYSTLVVQDLEKKSIDSANINKTDNRDWVEGIESSKD